MVRSTQIVRLDSKETPSLPHSTIQLRRISEDKLANTYCHYTSTGVPLCASVDDTHAETELADVKQQAKLIIRQLNQNSEPRASIESGTFTLQYASSSILSNTSITSLFNLEIQLPDRPTYCVPHCNRQILPTETRIHIPHRHCHRIQVNPSLLRVIVSFSPSICVHVL